MNEKYSYRLSKLRERWAWTRWTDWNARLTGIEPQSRDKLFCYQGCLTQVEKKVFLPRAMRPQPTRKTEVSTYVGNFVVSVMEINMGNDFLGQILGSVLGNSGSGQQSPISSGGGGAFGGLGGLLGGIMGGNSRQSDGGQDHSGQDHAGALGGLGGLAGLGGSGMGNKGGALLVMLLPLAMQWVQRNGGLGGVLQQFQHKGYSQQAASWVSTGPNEALEPQAVEDVVGADELSRLSQQLGVSQDEVSSGMGQILPEMVNHLTPQGGLPDDGNETLNRGMTMLEKMMNSSQHR